MSQPFRQYFEGKPGRFWLERAERKLRTGVKLNATDKLSVLHGRIFLIREGADMARVNQDFPLLDAIMGCDAAGNPIWRD